MPPRPRPSSRRQTMSTLNPNRRQTIDPGSGFGSSSTKKSRPPRGRKSMIPSVGRENVLPATPASSRRPRKQSTSTGNHRGRKSMGGDRRQSLLLVPPSSMPARTDSRPISDRAYQQDCVRRLLEFLQKVGYDQPISPKSLTRPSGKDFQNIVTFMLRLVDPNFQDGSMKIEDEVSMNFRAMGYPFTVSKTALVAAGSPHTWPTLLAALTWLMERIQCMENYRQGEDDDPEQFDSLEELDAQTDRVFFKYLSSAYTAFLKGDEKLTEELENALADRFERDDAIIEQEIEQMTDKNALIVEKLTNLAHGEDDLDHYTKKRDGYTTDIEQFHDLIQQMNQHVEALEKKKMDRTNELQETNRQLERSTVRVEELKQSISSQELSVEDIQKMKNELKGIDEAYDRAIINRDQRRKTLWEIESELEKTWNDLETVLSDYNSQLSELNLLPLVSAKSMNMKATIDKAAVGDSNRTKLIGVDLVSSVMPCLSSCKQEYNEKLSESKWKYQESLDQLESSEEKFTEAHEKLKIVDVKIEKCEETLEAERDALDAKLAVRAREAVSMESRVAALRDPIALEEQMAQYERQCTELESLRMKYEEDNIAKKKGILEEIERACKAIKEYDSYSSRKVAEVHKYRRDAEGSLGKLKVPKDRLS